MTDQLHEKTIHLLCELKEYLEEEHLDYTYTEPINEMLEQFGFFFDKRKQMAYLEAAETGDVKDLKEVLDLT